MTSKMKTLLPVLTLALMLSACNFPFMVNSEAALATSVAETVAAVEGIQQATSLPILCSMSFDTRGRTMMGVKPSQAATKLGAFGLAAIGGNCGASLDDMLQVVKEMAATLPGHPLIAKPNAGLPQLVNGISVYATTPEEMAQYAVQFVEAGARIVGGCCGSTPAHIAAIAEAVSKTAYRAALS